MLVGAFVTAFVFGMAAKRMGIAPLVGFLLAGIVIGPFTPGFVADSGLAQELADVGVILLMFGVGLHISIKDLWGVRKIAVPGAVVQILSATILGWALAHYGLGWTHGAAVMFGLALSTASTVVLLRALEDRHLVNSQEGRIAVGWLVVEDIAMVVLLLIVPALAGALNATGGGSPSLASLAAAVATTLVKMGVFVALMIVIGKRFIPWALHRVAQTGSRELFTLAILSIALGLAFGSAALFNVSFALGAFFAGLILNESELSHRAAADTLPLRDAFAVLFFVSVGILFDPRILITHPWAVAATLLIIVLGKSSASWLIVLMFGYSKRIALTISASLAQIGEFAFMLAQLGVTLGVLSSQGRDVILAGAILSIMMNPFLFALLSRLQPQVSTSASELERDGIEKGHVVLIGHGRVGQIVSAALRGANRSVVVIETDASIVARLNTDGMPAILGQASEAGVLETAGLSDAGLLISAIPNVFEAGHAIERARSLNPSLSIVARAHSDAEVEYLTKHGAQRVIMGEREIARRMIEYVMLGFEPLSRGAEQ